MATSIFQTSASSQSAAIQRATRSPWSHMGVVFLRDGVPFVFEAVDPVRATPLARWVARGVGGRFVVKRLKDAGTVLTPDAVRALRRETERFLGRHYRSRLRLVGRPDLLLGTGLEGV